MTIESYKEDGKPADQWYWDDWFAAFDVRLCSLEARGLWIDMLGIMFKARPRGTLTINGVQVDSKMMAKCSNVSQNTIAKLWQELEKNKVFSRLKDGTIINRRMYFSEKKKEDLRKKRSEAGKAGAEKRWGEDNKSMTNGMAKMASSSSSSSSSSSKRDSFSSKKNSATTYSQEFEDFWKEYPRQKRKPDAYTAWKYLNKEQKAEVIIAVKNYAIHIKRKKTEEQYILHASTFLRKDKERWKDYIEGDGTLKKGKFDGFGQKV